MEAFLSLNPVIAAVLIFLLRIVDVSLGTVRTISMVNGRIALSVLLGFFEVLIWIAVIAQVFVGVTESPILLVAYAAGFAAGTGVGIAIERKLAIGIQILHVISSQHGDEIAQELRELGQPVTSIMSEGLEGPVRMLHTTCPRRSAPKLVETALAVDPDALCIIETVTGISRRVSVPPHPTGWRGLAKRK